jgi:hypothetical protein
MGVLAGTKIFFSPSLYFSVPRRVRDMPTYRSARGRVSFIVKYVKKFSDEPISRSAYPFCHGDRGDVGRSSDAHGANTPKEHLAIGSIAIMDQVVRSLLPSAGLDQLAGNPFRGRMCCGP